MAYFQKTSPEDKKYNCIAWAAEDDKNFWWPIGGYWPQGIPREETMAAFIQAYQQMGYEICNNDLQEMGFQKVALFADKNGKPTHAARQLANGRWTSKLGRNIDVEHDLRVLAQVMPVLSSYGDVAAVLRRPNRS